MSLNTKLLICIIATWLGFLVAVYFGPDAFWYVILMAAMLLTLLFFTLSVMIVKHQTQVHFQREMYERKIAEKELTIHKEHLVRLAHYDNLTGLPNRVFFNEILNKTLDYSNKFKKQFAILFISLDRFKKINETLGHVKGDFILKELVTRFSAVVRSENILARLGGDEFILLLNDTNIHDPVTTIADKLLKTCSEEIKIDTDGFVITASIGICLFPQHGNSLEDLQKNADLAMYKAKRLGGNNYQYFTSEMDLVSSERIKLELALRKAVQKNQFSLFYQPKLSLEDGLIIGVEALIRWEHRELGFISPAKFIPLAEETGLILEIGRWALYEACRVNKSWQDQGYQPITIAVNLSPKQFRHHDIAKMIANVLEETKLAPQYLEIEITESTVMDNLDAAVKILQEIHSMGVNISIDDFGAGYTSISYLKKFPVNVLKIDQTLIKGIVTDANDLSITSAMIALAHSLGLKVVAEGVETVDQLKLLADNNCDIAQGYYLSRPLPEGKVVLQFAKIETVA